MTGIRHRSQTCNSLPENSARDFLTLERSYNIFLVDHYQFLCFPHTTTTILVIAGATSQRTKQCARDFFLTIVITITPFTCRQYSSGHFISLFEIHILYPLPALRFSSWLPKAIPCPHLLRSSDRQALGLKIVKAVPWRQTTCPASLSSRFRTKKIGTKCASRHL